MNDAIDQNSYDTSPFLSALRPNDAKTITAEVVQAARDCLVIGHTD